MGIIGLVYAVDCERTGVAVVYSPRNTTTPTVVKRADDPEGFRGAMTYVWYEVGSPIFLGVLILAWMRREDTLDPFSENFSGKSAINELEQTLDQEVENRKSRDI